jgi:AAA+ ATPase superfamily predicted ATPase
MNSPFIFGKVVKGKSFINRNDELKKLKINFSSGINTMLISPRRWGKTSLVKKAVNEIEKENKNIKVCFIDIYRINSEFEFYEMIMQEVLKKSATSWEEWIRTGKEFLKKVIPSFNIGLDPQNDFSVKVNWNDVEKSPDEILNLSERIARKRNLQFIICIDEFQKTADLKNSLAFQQKLRSVWQYHENTSYCLFGSKRHVITDLFQNQSMPFYKFGDLIFLQRIKKEYWIKHLIKSFSVSGKKLSKNIAEEIIQIAQNHPYYIQQISHQVWINTKNIVTLNTVTNSIDELLLYNGIMYSREMDNLTALQINYLRAIANNDKHLSSKENIQKYNLGTAGNIPRIKEALENKEIIDFFENKPAFIDPLFQYWFTKNYL